MTPRKEGLEGKGFCIVPIDGCAHIQLPPMPSDTPTELVAVVWIYARMEKPEKEQFLDFMQENIKSGTSDGEKEKLMALMEKSKLKPSPYVEEFHSLMQELIGTLIARNI